jgi:hypothetical protein
MKFALKLALASVVVLAALVSIILLGPEGHPPLPALTQAEAPAGSRELAAPEDPVLAVEDTLSRHSTPTPPVGDGTAQIASEARSFEDKYSGMTVEQLLAARKELVSVRVRKVDQLLKDLMARGQYEVVHLKAGEEYSPGLPSGWAVRPQVVSTEDGSEELRVVRLDMRNHPETEVMHAEVLWLRKRIDSQTSSPFGR